MADRHYLPKDDIGRVIRDSRYAEQLIVSESLPFNHPPAGNPDGGFNCAVTITDVLSDGYYTGRIDFVSSVPATPLWIVGQVGGENLVCKVTTLSGADKLVLGWRYPGRIDQMIPDDTLGAFPYWPLVVVDWTIPLGCGLRYSEFNYIEVDVGSLAGFGLYVDTSGDCDKLAVNVANLNSNVTVFACGLVFDSFNSTLKVDFTDVVTPPLTWDADLCSIDLTQGCGLDTVGGALVVDAIDLAGDKALTSLVPTGETECELAVDLEPFTTQEWVRDVIVGFSRTSGGKISLCWDRYTDTDFFNQAGMLIDHVLGSPVRMCSEVDVCDPDCCDDCTITLEVDASPTFGPAPLSVDLSLVTLSGCTGPYTLTVDWGDGSGSTYAEGDFPVTHEYTAPGSYPVVVTAQDACGFAATDTTITVEVGSATSCSIIGIAMTIATSEGGSPCGGGALANPYALTLSAGEYTYTEGSGAGPSDPGMGFGVTVQCNNDGTYNVLPVQPPFSGLYYSGPPATYNIVPTVISNTVVQFSLAPFTLNEPACAFDGEEITLSFEVTLS